MTESTSPRTTGNPGGTSPILSSFASDPDMTELIELFVSEMPDRVRQLSALWDAKDIESLKRAAHQLKGAGGGYGFATVSEAAGRLEQATGKLFASAPTSDLESVRRAVDEVIALCQRVSVR